jgi:hypothetical protein
MVDTIEITTVIGCPMSCKFCPQALLINNYNSRLTHLSYEYFKIILSKIPKNVRIDFSGFAEPFLNNRCVDMILYTYSKGYKIAVFTTAYNLSIEDVEKIKHIDFEIFKLHLPDVEKNVKIPTNQSYYKVIRYIKKHIKNYSYMSMGKLEPAAETIFKKAPIPRMHSRAGNITSIHNFNHTNASITCCGELPKKAVILPNGEAYLCCCDYGLKHKLGNLLCDSYKDIYESNEYDFVLHHMKNSNDKIICNKCINAIIE